MGNSGKHGQAAVSAWLAMWQCGLRCLSLAWLGLTLLQHALIKEHASKKPRKAGTQALAL